MGFSRLDGRSGGADERARAGRARGGGVHLAPVWAAQLFTVRITVRILAQRPRAGSARGRVCVPFVRRGTARALRVHR